jgi:alcohol dehydrogenase (cytochrome c)
MLQYASIALLLSGVGTAAVAASADWPSYNNTLQGARFAEQKTITPQNVATLAPVCTYDLGRQASFQTGPVVVGGIIFITTDTDTIALDGASCAVKWRTTDAYKDASWLKVNRGAAVLDGKVFRGTQDGRVLGYDASTGKQLWATTIADPAKGETVPAAPIAWDGMVFIGNAGGDSKGVKGRIYALNVTTGAILWEQYLVPRDAKDVARGPQAPEPKIDANGWGEAAKKGTISGGATWTSYSLDPVSGTLYVSSGNPSPDFAVSLREGDNPFAGAVIALDAKTGDVKNVYPLVQHDFHDWDASAAPAIITTAGGRKLAAAAIKDGYLHGIDLATGKQIYKSPVTTIENATTPFKVGQPVHFCPGAFGGAEWNGPAYSKVTNLLYTGAVDWCATVTLAPDAKTDAIEWAQAWTGDAAGGFGSFDPISKWAGWITASNADTGAKVWQYKTPAPVLGGVTATASGLVFAGDMAGHVFAFDAMNGNVLWQAQAPGAIAGGIVSYGVGSGQRIAVAGGTTSALWPTPKVNAQLVVYGLKM